MRQVTVFTLRFWNRANENIRVGGKYSHDFDTFQDAWDAAEALLRAAHKLDATEMDINNDYYFILKG